MLPLARDAKLVPMRPTDLRTRLNRLAELVSTSDKRRRVLENIDAIAQDAMDAEQTYVNKHGDAVTVEAPQYSVALKAQEVAARVLGLHAEDGEKDKPATDSPIKRILAAVPKAGGG